MMYVGLEAGMGSKFDMIGRFRQQIEASQIISDQSIGSTSIGQIYYS